MAKISHSPERPSPINTPHQKDWLLKESATDEAFGYCVVYTIQSMLSQISGQEIRLTDKEIEIRTDQMSKTLELIEKKVQHYPTDSQNIYEAIIANTQKKEKLEKLEAPLLRLDLMALQRYVQKLRDGNSAASNILQNCEIRFAKGNLDIVRKHLTEGWSVGLSTPLVLPTQTVEMHLFHIDLNANGLMFDKSDDSRFTNGKLKRIVDAHIQNGSLDRAIKLYLHPTNGSNLLLIKKSM